MSEQEVSPVATQWLTIPELMDVLGESQGRIRRLLAEQYLAATRRTGVLTVPSVFIVNARPLPSLRGTIIVLRDAGFDDDELIDWLLTPEETLGRAPIEALLAGHKSEVRRIARALA